MINTKTDKPGTFYVRLIAGKNEPRHGVVLTLSFSLETMFKAIKTTADAGEFTRMVADEYERKFYDFMIEMFSIKKLEENMPLWLIVSTGDVFMEKVYSLGITPKAIMDVVRREELEKAANSLLEMDICRNTVIDQITLNLFTFLRAFFLDEKK